MCDTYDYAYDHVVRRPEEEVISYVTSLEGQNSECDVNTADFSDRDLQMFVDSLETIARLEKNKAGQRQKRKTKKQAVQPKRRQVTCLDSSSCSSIHDDDEDTNSFSDSSFSSEYHYDETYFGIPQQGQSTALYSNLIMDNNSNTASDSDDSGVYVSSNTTAGHLYENIQPSRLRSKKDSHSKYKALKTRLLALVARKQNAKPQILSSTNVGEQFEENEIYERVIMDVIQQKLSEKSEKPKQKSSVSRSGHKLLSKAMRLLTL